MLRTTSARSMTALALALPFGLAILLAVRPSAAHPPSIQSPAAEAATGEEVADVLAKLRTRLAARTRSDVAALYSAGFTHIDADGRQRDRRAHLQAVARGEAVAEAAEMTDRLVRSPNGWVAVVTGRIRESAGRPDPRPDATQAPRGGRELRATIVLTRAGDSWQIAATHVTPVAPNPSNTTRSKPKP